MYKLLLITLGISTLYAQPNPVLDQPLIPHCSPIQGQTYFNSATVIQQRIIVNNAPEYLLLPKSGNFLLTGGNYP